MAMINYTVKVVDHHIEHPDYIEIERYVDATGNLVNDLELAARYATQQAALSARDEYQVKNNTHSAIQVVIV
jgi:hypothetical protein